MNLATVTFDRVFDLHRRVGGRFLTHTQFGFESDGQVHYSVSVPGLPTIETAMTVTAILAEAGNWQSLKGWRNWSSGELALPATGQSLTSACCCMFMVFLFAPTGKSDYFGLATAFSVFMALLAAGLLVQWWRQRTVVRVLKELNEQSIIKSARLGKLVTIRGAGHSGISKLPLYKEAVQQALLDLGTPGASLGRSISTGAAVEGRR